MPILFQTLFQKRYARQGPGSRGSCVLVGETSIRKEKVNKRVSGGDKCIGDHETVAGAVWLWGPLETERLGKSLFKR